MNLITYPYDINNFWSRFPYDSGYYWSRAASILDGTDTLFRGFVFPLYLGICGSLWNNIKAWFFIYTLVNSVFFSIILPALVNFKDYKEYSLAFSIKVFISFALLYLFFWGTFVYPLSDLFALQCACISIFYMKRIFFDEINKVIFIAINMFISAIFAYFSYNTRTIYLFFVIAASLYFIFYLVFRCKKNNVIKVIACISFFLGLCFASFPQIFLNHKKYGNFSPLVPTNGLMSHQVFWGLEIQRYETYVGKEIDVPQVNFNDIHGDRLYSEYTTNYGTKSLKNYLKFVFHHPIDMAGLYMRHLINMMLPVFPSEYIQNLNNPKFLYAILSSLVLFLWGISVFSNCISIKKTLYLIPILIPTIMIIPGAVEGRFSLPIYVYILSSFFMLTDFSLIWNILKKHYVKLVIAFIVFELLLLAIWTECLGSYRQNILLNW